MSMRLKPVIVVPIGLSVSAISAAFLFLQVQEWVRDREEYNSWIPFAIGMAIALPVGLWPVSLMRSPARRLVVRSLVFTLLLAPVPFGPEGSVVPALLALLYPPGFFMFLHGPLLTFGAVFGLVASAESIWLGWHERSPNKPIQPTPR